MEKKEIYDVAPEHLMTDLSEFKRIQANIRSLWGTIELDTYLNTLMSDTRNNTRQGFPPKAAAVIIKMSLYNSAYLYSKNIKGKEPDINVGYRSAPWKIPKGF